MRRWYYFRTRNDNDSGSNQVKSPHTPRIFDYFRGAIKKPIPGKQKATEARNTNKAGLRSFVGTRIFPALFVPQLLPEPQVFYSLRSQRAWCLSPKKLNVQACLEKEAVPFSRRGESGIGLTTNRSRHYTKMAYLLELPRDEPSFLRTCAFRHLQKSSRFT